MGRTLLPLFRSSLANQLVKEFGFSEVDVARALGITQAAVSQYLHAKRAKKRLERAMMRQVDKMARKAALEMSHNKISSEEMMRIACQLCAVVRGKARR